MTMIASEEETKPEFSAHERRFRRRAVVRLLAAKVRKGDTVDELAIAACVDFVDEIMRRTK